LSGCCDVAGAGSERCAGQEFYIFTHPDTLSWLENRVERFLSTYRKLGPALQEMKR